LTKNSLIHALYGISCTCPSQMSLSLFEHYTDVADTEINCRAKMLIYLVEHGLWTREISKGV